VIHANDDRPMSSRAASCGPTDLESVRAWLLVELIEDDVDHGPLLADLAVCDARISAHGLRPLRTRPILHCVA
jgi:hypothetical protein